MSRTIKEIMLIASQATKPPTFKREEEILEAQLFNRKFDEKENIKDQYESIFDINSTSSRNVSGAFIGESKSTWEDVKNDLEFEVTNDSMLIDNIIAETNPDRARPTMSRETLQSLSQLNVMKPIDLSKSMRQSRMSSMNYRMFDGNEVEGVGDSSFVMDVLKNTALFGLNAAKKEVKKIADPTHKSIDKVKNVLSNYL